MRSHSRAASALIGMIVLLSTVGCEAPRPTTPPSPNNAPANNNAAPISSASPVANSNSSSASAGNDQSLPITLPVLDAVFADAEFTGELKSKLQLTDDQLGQLRAAAREETSKLRESGESGDEYGGSTAAAQKLYEEKTSAAVGPEKTKQLADFLRAKWSEGVVALPAGGPNAVPSDTRVVVNAPAYRMDVFENGRLAKTYRIGIGYPEFPLPTGMRQATTIIFNPTWTPPDEPWVESPSSKVRVGQKVEAGSALNPLGVIKIPIGSPSLIHGGKTAARLGNFASHGCVGLTNSQVQDFAQTLARLGGAEVTPEQVAEYEKSKTETKNVKMSQSVPVELRYETIVVEADGKLHIYRDVYDRGTNTEENLRAVLSAHGVNFDQLSAEERARIDRALPKMARDARGNPSGLNPTPEPTTAANKNESDGRVTRDVKGEKEIVIELAALRGKGYPLPVELNAGEKPQPAKKAAARR